MKRASHLALLLLVLVASGCGSDVQGDPCEFGWQDANGVTSCPTETPVSCDRATDCFATVALCEDSGQCQ